jgi:hypothetical protein
MNPFQSVGFLHVAQISESTHAKLGAKHQAENERRGGLSRWPERPTSLISFFCDERLKRFPTEPATAVGKTCARVPVTGAVLSELVAQ